VFYVGVDLGQRRDHSAIAVVEQWQKSKQRLVRSVTRVPLGTPYPDVVERVRRTVQHAELAGQCAVVVDATGVGAPVVEMMHRAGLGCGLWAVTMTSGEQARAAGSMGGVSRFTVPKVDLISGVQTLLESGNLRIAPDLREAGSLLRELRDMRMEVTGAGRMRLGADGCGEHDDLVIALALACWRAGRGQIGFGGARLPGC